ncbi:MAG TPA: HPF/RaiA family ribosome-associated protein [Nannocystaceae bacterium]|nr:HPF/RaiA family ribosome-associated protein [Nannocystaceae bacterium]
MSTPVNITFQDLHPSAALEAVIRDRASRLRIADERITNCRVALSRTRRRGRQGHIYQVRIEISRPGDDVVVSREPGLDHTHEDVYVAIRDAFDAARRQLHDHDHRRTGR